MHLRCLKSVFYVAEADIEYLSRLEAGGLELEATCIYHTSSSQDNQSDHRHESPPAGGVLTAGHYPGCGNRDRWSTGGSAGGGSDMYGQHRFGLGRNRMLANSGIVSTAGGSEAAWRGGAVAGRTLPPAAGQSAHGTAGLDSANGERVWPEQVVGERVEMQPRWQRLLVKTISCMVTSLLTVWAGKATLLIEQIF
jgi:hypothetical protein